MKLFKKSPINIRSFILGLSLSVPLLCGSIASANDRGYDSNKSFKKESKYSRDFVKKFKDKLELSDEQIESMQSVREEGKIRKENFKVVKK
jgi:hypothetical protein